MLAGGPAPAGICLGVAPSITHPEYHHDLERHKGSSNRNILQPALISRALPVIHSTGGAA